MPSTLAGVCLEAIARHDKPDAVSEKREGQFPIAVAVETWLAGTRVSALDWEQRKHERLLAA